MQFCITFFEATSSLSDLIFGGSRNSHQSLRFPHKKLFETNEKRVTELGMQATECDKNEWCAFFTGAVTTPKDQLKPRENQRSCLCRTFRYPTTTFILKKQNGITMPPTQNLYKNVPVLGGFGFFTTIHEYSEPKMLLLLEKKVHWNSYRDWFAGVYSAVHCRLFVASSSLSAFVVWISLNL